MRLGLGATISKKAIKRKSRSLFSNDKSLNFDGSNDYVELGASNALITGTNVTISIWFKNSSGTLAYMFQNRRVGPSSNLSVGVNMKGDGAQLAGWIGIVMYTGSGHIYTAYDGNVDDGAWHHWVIYIDPTDIFKCQAYCDGVLQEKFTTSFSSGSANAYTQPLTIGSIRQEGGLSYEGKLDEFAIFDEELSLSTIKAMYNSGTPTDLTQNSGDYQSADNLAVYYRFENVDFPNADSIIGTATGVMTNMAEDDITEDTP